MTDGAPEGSAGDAADAPDLRRLAQDWIDLWQSELAAIAVDREAQESWQAILALWAGAASALLQGMPRSQTSHNAHERTSGRTGAEPAAGAAPAAAAPDPRDAEIERLARHVAELEARLAGLERGDRRQPPRQRSKRKS